MGLQSRYLREARGSEVGSLRLMLVGREAFRFRYPRAVELGGSGRVAGRATVGGRPASWHDDYCLARAFAVKPVAPQSGAPPAGRWGLTAQRGPSKGDLHAINTEVRLSLPGQSNPLVIK
jgi:hypothetical protein